ncbi:MAG: hypothetical protein ACRDFX_08290 [Chloroflexota bacterium]
MKKLRLIAILPIALALGVAGANHGTARAQVIPGLFGPEYCSFSGSGYCVYARGFYTDPRGNSYQGYAEADNNGGTSGPYGTPDTVDFYCQETTTTSNGDVHQINGEVQVGGGILPAFRTNFKTMDVSTINPVSKAGVLDSRNYFNTESAMYVQAFDVDTLDTANVRGAMYTDNEAQIINRGGIYMTIFGPLTDNDLTAGTTSTYYGTISCHAALGLPAGPGGIPADDNSGQGLDFSGG